MPGSSTTPGRPGTRAYAPVCIAFHLRNGVGTRDMNLCEAQWLAYALPYRRFAAALTDGHARLRVDVDRYSFIVSDLHRLLVAGLPAHCERFCTSSTTMTERHDWSDFFVANRRPAGRRRQARCLLKLFPGDQLRSFLDVGCGVEAARAGGRIPQRPV